MKNKGLLIPVLIGLALLFLLKKKPGEAAGADTAAGVVEAGKAAVRATAVTEVSKATIEAAKATIEAAKTAPYFSPLSPGTPLLSKPLPVSAYDPTGAAALEKAISAPTPETPRFRVGQYVYGISGHGEGSIVEVKRLAWGDGTPKWYYNLDTNWGFWEFQLTDSKPTPLF